MRKPTMWFLNRSDTNQAVQIQTMALGCNLLFRKSRNFTIRIVKTKALISFAVTAPVFSHMQNVGFLMMRLIYSYKNFIEPPHGKTNYLQYAKTETQISFAVTAKLISAFVFATRIVHFLIFLNPKCQASSLLL